MARRERPAGDADGPPKGQEVRRSKVQLSLDDEIAWRLRVYATMKGVAPGQIVEGWIRPHLKGVRMPYDAYRRGVNPSTGGPEEVSASPADEARDSGATLPIAETLTSPGGDAPAEVPGQGRGARKRPA
jgi:hypothetical protein